MLKEIKYSKAYFVIESEHHMWEAGKLEENKEDKLTGEMLPELVATVVLTAVLVLLFRSLHGNDDEIDELIFQHQTSLFRLKTEINRYICYLKYFRSV